jgi:hypothetical protein
LGTFDNFSSSPSGRLAVPVHKELLIFLWHVGSLEPLCRTADRFNVTEFTVLRVSSRIREVVLQHFVKKYIVWPKDQNVDIVTRAFTDKRGFPDVKGALDSSHIQIRPPKEHSQTYVNRKGYHSIILIGCSSSNFTFYSLLCWFAWKLPRFTCIKNSEL